MNTPDLSTAVAVSFALISALHAAALPRWVVAFGAPVTAVVLLARSIGDFRYIGFFKRVRDTRFAKLDTRIYSPIALLLGIATAVVAWGMP